MEDLREEIEEKNNTIIDLAEPIVIRAKDDINSLGKFIESLENEIGDDEERKKLIEDYPVVYIHTWIKSKHVEEDKAYNWYGVYIGETNNIIQRTGEHYDSKDKMVKNKQHYWSWNITKDANLPEPDETYAFVMGHEHFNKSLTLDIENRFIHYLEGSKKIKHIANGRGNYQRDYFKEEEMEPIFDKLWEQLHELNSEVFPDKKEIEDSAIFKCSPFHKLTSDQEEAKGEILKTIRQAILKTKEDPDAHVLVLIEGEAGTGKTVLMSSIFKDLLQTKYEKYEVTDDYESDTILDEGKHKYALIVNHKEQENVYRNIFEQLGYTDVVYNPTSFINTVSIEDRIKCFNGDKETYRVVGRTVDENSIMDVAFIDEAHLLRTQANMAYTGDFTLDYIDELKEECSKITNISKNEVEEIIKRKEKEIKKKEKQEQKQGNAKTKTKDSPSQLKDIMSRAKVTIAMIDEHQIIRNDEYFEPTLIEEWRSIAKYKKTLDLQKRMHMDKNAAVWHEQFVNGIVKPLPKETNYDIKIFDNPNELFEAIKEKSKIEESKLSRVIASYDWEYKADEKKNPETFCVEIGDFKKPWNYEIEKKHKEQIKQDISQLAWAEQEHTIDEIGSTFTVQGFDLKYAGVILGPSIKLKVNENNEPIDENGNVVKDDEGYILEFDYGKSGNKHATEGRSEFDEGQNDTMRKALIKNEFYVLCTRGVAGLYIYACDENLRKLLLKFQEDNNN